MKQIIKIMSVGVVSLTMGVALGSQERLITDFKKQMDALEKVRKEMPALLSTIESSQLMGENILFMIENVERLVREGKIDLTKKGGDQIIQLTDQDKIKMAICFISFEGGLNLDKIIVNNKISFYNYGKIGANCTQELGKNYQYFYQEFGKNYQYFYQEFEKSYQVLIDNDVLPYQNKAMQQVTKQRHALSTVAGTITDHDSNEYVSVQNGVDPYGQSLKYVYDRQFKEKTIQPFSAKFKQLDQNNDRIHEINKKLKATDLSDDDKTKLTDEHKKLTDDNKKISEDYVKAIKEVEFKLSDKDRKWMNNCANGASISGLSSGGIDADKMKFLSEVISGSNKLSFGNIKFDKDSNFTNETLKGEDYLNMANGCLVYFNQGYQGLINNKGVDKTGSDVGIKLTEDQIKVLKDALKKDDDQ